MPEASFNVSAPPPRASRTRPFSPQDTHVVQKEPAYDGPPPVDGELHGLVAAMRAYVDTQVVPANFHEDWLTIANPIPAAGTELKNSGLGFPIHAVLIDNLSPAWLQIEPGQRLIAPWVIGVIYPVPTGHQAARVRIATNAGLVNLAAVAGAQVWVGFSEAFLQPSSGILLPATYHS